jgi:PncC family amidohydrolase
MSECDIEIELVKKAEKTAQELVEKLKKISITLALAESCTAGLVSSLLVRVPGASCVLWGSFVCYTNEAKVSMLALNDTEIAENGPVSRKVACLMAEAALQKSGANMAASVTGLAGPALPNDESMPPAGTIWVAIALKSGVALAREFHFKGSRNDVRIHAAIAVMEMIMEGAL